MDEENKVCELCKNHSGFEARLKERELQDEQQWTAINNVRNRPPIWCTAIIALLTFLCGCAFTYAQLANRLYHGGS